MMKKYILLFPLLLAGISMTAQDADTLAVAEKKSERNMMLNAESATAPREINIGLPEGGSA